MLIPLLSVALAVCAPASAQPVPPDTLGAARRAEIAVLASDWISAKSRVYRMTAVFVEAAVKEGRDRKQMTHFVDQIRALCNEVEEVQYAASQLARQAVIDSAPPSPSRLEREKAVEALFEGRALIAYANLAPTAIDEEIKDAQGNNDGRRLAGREWVVSLTNNEAVAYNRWQFARTGFTSAEYKVFIDKAAAALGDPAPKEPWP